MSVWGAVKKLMGALGGVFFTHAHNNTIQWRLLKHDKNPKEKGKGKGKEKEKGMDVIPLNIFGRWRLSVPKSEFFDLLLIEVNVA